MSVEKSYSTFLQEIFHKAYILKSGNAVHAVNSPEYDQNFDGNFHEIIQLELALNAAKAHTGEILKTHSDPEWHAHTAFLHPLKQLPKVLRQKYGIPFCTQAYCKFTEILSHHPQLAETPTKSDEFRSFHLCEAPGGFVTALGDFIGVARSDSWSWHMNSLNPYNEFNDPKSMLLDDTIIYPNLDKMEFGPDESGNILNWNEEFIAGLPKFHLVTADGSFDVRDDPKNQETLTFPLISKEVQIALHCLELGGSLVVKMFTFFHPDTIHFLNKLMHMFNEVVVRKPACSKSSNSEVYIVCLGYHGNPNPPCDLTNGNYHRILECSRFFCVQQENAILFNVETFNNISATEKCFINEKNFEAINRWQELNLNDPDRFHPSKKPEVEPILNPWAKDSWSLDTNKWQEVIQKGRDSASSELSNRIIEIYWAVDSLYWLMDTKKPDIIVIATNEKRDTKIRHSIFMNSYLLLEALDKDHNLVDFAQGPHYEHHVPARVVNGSVLNVDAAQMDKRSWLELLANLADLENTVDELRITSRQNDLMLSRFSVSVFVLLSVLFDSVQFEKTGAIIFKHKLNIDAVLNNVEKYTKNLLDAYYKDGLVFDVLRFVPMECFRRPDIYSVLALYNNHKCLDVILSA